MSDKFLWVESYAPKGIDDCILPADIKAAFKSYAESGEFPNLILAGPAGVGKTSLSRALAEQLDVDLLFINASNNRGIDEVRTTLNTFASSSSLFGKKKMVLLDEADNMTQDAQKALRAMIEEFQNHCRFVLTCNYPHNIIDAIHSRCTVFDFHVRGQKQLTSLSGKFFKRASGILKENSIEFDEKLLAKYIMGMAPDWRGILNGLQGKTADGVLDPSILSQSPDALVEFLKAKRWKDAQEWIFENSFLHPKQLERSLYRALQPHLADQSKPQIVLLFANYSDKINSGADPSITLLALATEIMMEAEWK